MSSWPRDLAKRRTWRAGPPMFMRVVKSRTDGALPVPPESRLALRGAAGPVHGPDRDKDMSRSSISLTAYPASTHPGHDGQGWSLTVERDGAVGWTLRRAGGRESWGLPGRCVALF